MMFEISMVVAGICFGVAFGMILAKMYAKNIGLR